MALGIRGSNPIWWIPDLDGNPFDDTYYMWVLNNDIPYTPLPIYADDELMVPLQNPVQFLANGTLPVDLFFPTGIIYRLEFRQGNANFPSQSDPLIYLVENYDPGSGSGSGPIESAAFTTENQITNPQFAFVNFTNGTTFTGTNPSDISLGPGWFLHLEGTGTYTLNQATYNSETPNPTNASYALNLVLSGTWMVAYIYQQFSQNALLWANSSSEVNPIYISSSVTASLSTGSPQVILARFKDSQGNTRGEINYSNGGSVNGTFQEFQGSTMFVPSPDTDFPINAYIQFQLILPNSVDINLTSFQLVVGQEDIDYEYAQDSIERQTDHTFNYYFEELLVQAKDDLLVGWNFASNPWQFNSPTIANVAANQYTADQTVVIQQNYVNDEVENNVAVGMSGNLFSVSAVTTLNQFALVQYIDNLTCAPYLGAPLSSLVQLSNASTSPCTFKAKIIVNNNIPSVISRTEPVSAWLPNGEPEFASGWTVISAQNDPAYTIPANTMAAFVFNRFIPPGYTGNTQTIALVIYTTNSIPTSDAIRFHLISLVANQYGIYSAPRTFEQTLTKCQYYYEQSYGPMVLPGTATALNCLAFPMRFVNTTVATVINFYPITFSFRYASVKRAIPTTTLYSIAGTQNAVTGIYVLSASMGDIIVGDIASSSWTNVTGGTNPTNGVSGITYIPLNFVVVETVTVNSPYCAQILYQYTADARLGIIT